MTKLHVVKPDKYLHFPPEVDIDRGLWLEPGGVVDMDDGFIRACVRGQEYKLEPAPEDVTEQSPIPVRRMVTMREEWHGRALADPTDEDSAREEGAERLEAEGGTGEIQKARVDRPTKKRAPVAQKAESA